MKTNELTGVALDWAVAKCVGRREPEVVNNFHVAWHTWGNTHYSTNWAQGGPIIERGRIELEHDGFQWWARIRADEDYSGPAPLVAAMRCYVASVLGDEVEVPDELGHT